MAPGEPDAIPRISKVRACATFPFAIYMPPAFARVVWLGA